MVLYRILGKEETLLWSTLSPEHGRTALLQMGKRCGLRAISTRWWPLKHTKKEISCWKRSICFFSWVLFIINDLPAALIRKRWKQITLLCLPGFCVLIKGKCIHFTQRCSEKTAKHEGKNSSISCQKDFVYRKSKLLNHNSECQGHWSWSTE